MKSLLRSFPISSDSLRTAVRYWRKFEHLVLVNRLGSLSLGRNNLVNRLNDRPDRGSCQLLAKVCARSTG